MSHECTAFYALEERRFCGERMEVAYCSLCYRQLFSSTRIRVDPPKGASEQNAVIQHNLIINPVESVRYVCYAVAVRPRKTGYEIVFSIVEQVNPSDL